MIRAWIVACVAAGTAWLVADDALQASPLADTLGGCGGTVAERTLDATPATYQSILAGLGPGDRLRLAAGTYPNGLRLHDLDGEADRCIVIEGPVEGPAAVFTGRDCCNTISLSNASYLVVRNLEVDGQGRLGDAVKAESTADAVHHITLENLNIHDVDVNQQIVGINTKCPTWNWVIRHNVITRAGTGIYLGDSDGSAAFVNGLIEHNLVTETLGYNIQIKHQNARRTDLGAPASGQTVLRHNVFSKATGSNGGYDARPNLLVGHWPLTGAGAEDDYLIYGNFLHQNPTEALFQGEGNVAFYGNLLVNDSGPAIRFQAQNDVPRRVRVYQNTVVASGTGIRVSGGAAAFVQSVVGNAVFAATPLQGGTQSDNITDTYAAAASYLTNPDGVLTGSVDRFDLFPLIGALDGPSIDRSGIAGYLESNRDWNGRNRPGTFRGAYAGAGVNPGWLPALARKPDVAIFADGFESGDVSAWSP